jgi:Flp pilus assembly secretin CpaC
MSVRFLIVSLAGLALCGVGLTRSSAQCLSVGRTKLERHVYPVADLIVPVEDATGAEPVTQTGVLCSGPCGSSGCTSTRSAAARTLEDRLIKLIRDTVAPATWQEQGGPGKIEYYPIGMSLIVHQTPAVQKQIAALLTQLRRTQDMNVAVELRLISVPDGLLEKFVPTAKQENGVPIPSAGTCPPECKQINAGHKGTLAFLNNVQLFCFLEAVQGDRRTNIMQAPKLTVANGQCATVNVTDQQYYVTHVNVCQAGGQVVFCPVNEAFPIGLKLTVQPAVSADRHYVRLGVKADVTNLESAQVPLFPVTYVARNPEDKNPTEQRVTQYVQQPRLSSAAVAATVSVPDGGTVLLGGLKRVQEGRVEYGPPGLSKIPYIDRLFKNVGYGHETQQLLVLVTPRIIVNEEEEQTATAPSEPKADYTCPYLKDQQARPAPAAAVTAPAATVVENLKNLEAARELYQSAEDYRKNGNIQTADWYYQTVRNLCPGSRYDSMARDRQAEMQASATKDAEAGAEEQREPNCHPDARVAKLLRQYQDACAEGRLAEATQFAIQALAIDPTCFDGRHQGVQGGVK